MGTKLSAASGVKLTTKEQKTYGCAMAKVRDVIVRRNPILAKNMAHCIMGNKKETFTRLMHDEKFTTHAVKDMETQKTSAWLANSLSVEQREIPSLESLFSTEPKTTPDNPSLSAITPTHLKQLRSKPFEFLEMQKRNPEEKQQ